MTMTSGSWSSSDGPEVVLREARQRFIASFPKRCDSIELLLEAMAARGAKGSAEPLREIAHQVAGMAGTVGFPKVSERAADIELLAAVEGALDLNGARAGLAALRDTFAREIASPPAWATVPAPHPGAGRILVVDDADDQRQLVGDFLKVAGYDPLPIATGDVVLEAAKAHAPRAILLDANLPGLDGYSVCRLLKADPELASIPVVFMTVRSSLDDKLAGLTLGADDYLVKPVDLRELLLRVELLIRRQRSAAATPPPDQRGQLLNYDLFVGASRELLKQSPASFALVRVPEDDSDTVVAALRSSVRQKDIVSLYDPTHIVMLLGGAPPALVRHRIADLVGRLKERNVKGIWAGISFSTAPADKPIETLIAEADEALADARHRDEPAAVKSDRPRAGAPVTGITVLVAESDPEVVRTIESQMRASGYQIVVAADSVEILDVVSKRSPEVLLLDLTFGQISGFDILTRLQEQRERRPRVVVLSDRGREDDVTRAFEMGADDYVSKPFSPTELLARVARLLR